MVRRITTSGAGVEVVVGKAGAGKTFALDAAREAWQSAGYQVIGTALAARAVHLGEGEPQRLVAADQVGDQPDHEPDECHGETSRRRAGAPLARSQPALPIPSAEAVSEHLGLTDPAPVAKALDEAFKRDRQP